MTTPDPRLSLNQATVKRADLATALRVTAEAGITSIGLWREAVQEVGLGVAARMLTDSGLRLTTHCRGGFFTIHDGLARRASLDDNRAAIEEAATLAAAGAPGSTAVLVLVAGGIPEGSRDLAGARARVRDALGDLAPEAEAAGVVLAVEPLHPMYASDRCVVSTLGQALDIVSDLDPAVAAVTIDTFHLWWDPELPAQLARAGREGRIASYQVCDWRTPLEADVLLSRHYPGEGVIDFGVITRAVLDAGYTGQIEVEIFNEEIWATAPDHVVRRTVASFADAVSPHLRGAVGPRS